MQDFAKIIAASEDWLMGRVFSYALERGYTTYMSPLKEAWRRSINGLSSSLQTALQGNIRSMELGPEDTFVEDPGLAFAVQEARRHRGRGISLPMFLSLLKHYRQSYLDLVGEADMAAEARAMARPVVERFFDRVEVGIASEWCGLSDAGKLAEMQEANRAIVDEKNSYLTLFESLTIPAAFITREGLVSNLNKAAVAWLGYAPAPGCGHFHTSEPVSRDGESPSALCGRRSQELFPWLWRQLEQFLADGTDQLRFEQRIGKGAAARDVIATLSLSQDISGKTQGVVLVIQDVTDLSAAQKQLSRANQRLEREVRARTKALEDSNEQLKSEVLERGIFQQALSESASLYRAVVEDQGELICRFKPEGTILFANRAYTSVFGDSPVSLSGGPGLILHEGEQRSLAMLLAQITVENPVLRFEQQATTPSGQTAWYNWTCRGIFEDGAAPEAYQLVGQDATRSREAEQALREFSATLENTVRERTGELEERARSSELLTRTLQEQVRARQRAEVALARSAAEQQVKVRQITALFALSEVLNARWTGMEEMLQHAANAILQGWRNQSSVSGEIEFDDRSYHVRPLQKGCGCLIQPLAVFGHERGSMTICLAGPCDLRTQSFHADEEALFISMARQLERSLEAWILNDRIALSEREFREFFGNAAEAIFVHDETGQIIDANKNAALWLNLSTESLVGMSLLDFAAAEDRESLAGRFRNAQREAPELFHTTLRRKDGFAIPLEMLCQAQGYAGRTLLVSSGRNIAKRQQAEAIARRRMEQEQLMSRISSRLVNAIGAEVPGAMTETLAEICGFVGMQRAAVYHFDASGKRFALAHQWHSPELPPLSGMLKNLGSARTPWLYERSLAREPLAISSVRHLPPAAHKEKVLLAEAEIGCLTAIPMSHRDRLQGLFVVACRSLENATPPDTQLLAMFTPMFSNVMLRQRNRDALRESANLTTSILNALSAYLCVLDKRGAITMTNRAWQESGAKHGPAVAGNLGIGGNYLKFWSSAAKDKNADAAEILSGIESVLSGQAPLFRMEFSSRSGPALQWFLLEATPRGKGRRGAVVTHLDITAKKRAERRLSRNEARYRTLIEALHEGLLMVRKGGVMAYLNDQFARMLGWPKAKLLGRTPEEFVAPESLGKLRQVLAEEGGSIRSEEIIWNHSSGRRVYTLVSPSTARDDEGNAIGVYAVVTDTTERKGLESQLLQSQKLEAIGQLAAGIAHEINTPAQYVGNNVQFIKGAFEDILAVCAKARGLVLSAKDAPPTQADMDELAALMAERDLDYLEAEVPGAIAQTLEGVERISTIVRSVKQFAHPGASVMAPADLNEAMLSTVTVSRNEWKYVAELETDLDGALPLVICMIGELNQVVLNLIVNAAHAIADAIKADPERKGRITLSTKLAPPWAEIRVTDTGTGIPPAAQAKIFDPFFTTKEVGRGTGQGLTISRSIVVEKHQGQLFFETEPGVGTTFVVRLPLERKDGGDE